MYTSIIQKTLVYYYKVHLQEKKHFATLRECALNKSFLLTNMKDNIL